MFTPWGPSDYQVEYKPGIVFYGTPSHGGFRVSGGLLEQMPPQMRCMSGYPDGWYEEDCDWAAVAYVYPEAFLGRIPGVDATLDAVQAYARGVLERWNPDVLTV